MCRAAAWALVMILFGCIQPPAPPASTPAITPHAELATTSGALAIGNLSSQIESADREVQKQPRCAPCLVSLADLLLTRAQITCAPSDLEHALNSAKAAVALSRDGVTLLGLARAKSALHLFEEARRDAWIAALLRADAFGLLASIDGATGKTEKATRYWEAAVQERADTNRLAHLAVLVAATGEMERASELFARAAKAYRDVSPFAVAWLEMQEGLGWQAAGNLDRARALFQRAHDRLPQSPAIDSHLAAVETDPDRAITLLEPFAHAEDPEPTGQLASLLALRHRADEAAALATEASLRYDALLEKYPEAYADHAARFWLSAAGHDPEKALRWARVNLRNRDTAVARALFREAMAAAPKTLAASASVSF